MRARLAAWIAAAALSLGAGLGAPAGAQPRRAGSAAPPAASERREEIKKRIRSMRAYTLTEELKLDPEIAGQLFPLLARYDDETDKLLEKRVEVQRRLRRAEATRDPRAVDRLIDEALANQRSFRDLEDRRLAELRKILTPFQTAKLLVVLPDFERRIQNQLRRAIGQRPGAAGATGGGARSAPAGAAADGDDDPEPDEAPPPRRTRPRRDGPAPAGPPSSGPPGNTPPCDPARGPCR
jgi:Spy/CpxP family protein refolding chaperone